MTITYLIKILADVCRYNANADIYIRVNGKTVPLHHCVDDFVGRGKNKKRVVTLVPEGDDYFGE